MIYYVRHGQTINNVDGILYDHTAGPELTPTGVAQAQATAEKLKDVKFDICYCSPLNRAKQTTQIIAQYHPDLPIVYDDRLRERSYGALGGKHYSILSEPLYSKRWHRDTVLPYPNVESVDACYARVKEFLDAINDPQKNILVVAHGGLYKLVHCYFHGFPADGDLTTLHLDNCGFVTFAENANH